MNNVILKFDKFEVSDEEMQEHIDWYLRKVKEGYQLLEEDKAEAMKVLREINKNLEQEYKYYDKVSVQNILMETRASVREYCHGIFEAYVKQTEKNSYSMLDSNFFDIQDYIGMIDI